MSGIVAHIDEGQLAGFTFLVGGGMGMTHTDRQHPRPAWPTHLLRRARRTWSTPFWPS